MRRLALVVAMLVTLQGPASAQDQSRKLPAIGWLRVASPEMPVGEPMRVALARHGLVDGRDYRLDVRSAEGQVERIPALARQIVHDAPAIIVAFGPDAVRETRALTSTVPIVAAAAFLEEGFASTLSRPSGNLTGVSLLVSELDPKKLEILSEMLPGIRRIGVLNDKSTNVAERPALLSAAALKLGLSLTTVDVKVPEEFDAAFATFAREGTGAVLVNASTLFATMRKEIGDLSKKYRQPAMCQWRTMVEAGCTASYGAPFEEMMELIGDQVAQILRGARPDAIPIVQPRRFELVVSNRVAREIGAILSPSILLRADEVIE